MFDITCFPAFVGTPDVISSVPRVARNIYLDHEYIMSNVSFQCISEAWAASRQQGPRWYRRSTLTS